MLFSETPINRVSIVNQIHRQKADTSRCLQHN